MSPEVVAEIYRNAITITLVLSAPVLGAALVVGTVVSVLQTATQINEMTLTFVPKALAVLGVLWLLSSWLLDQWLSYAREIFSMVEDVARLFA